MLKLRICTEVDEVNESLRTDVCMKREDIRWRRFQGWCEEDVK